VIRLAFAILAVAVVSGSVLAVYYARGVEPWPPHAAAPPIHGAVGATSLIVLLLALDRGLPSSQMGTSGFAPIAAGLLAAALGLGLALALLSWRRGRPGGALVGVHASLAIAGFVLLLALVALG
jgi:asparagine N-glycosylation enzyme membrane subunit Stt3